MSLSKLAPGTRAVILEYTEDDPKQDGLSRRLMEMGLTIGTEVEVAHKAPFGGAIAVRCRGALIALRLSDAAKIRVTNRL